MAGGRLEVSFSKSGIYASFTAYADFLIAWDPFHYDVRVGVSVTAGFRIRVCFFACVTIDVHITLLLNYTDQIASVVAAPARIQSGGSCIRSSEPDGGRWTAGWDSGAR